MGTERAMGEYLAPGSYIAILVVLVLTGMGLPVPEEVPIVAAGVLSAHDHLNPWLALLVCIVGALLGDTASYWLGYHFGRGLLQRRRWWARVVTPERELRLERLIRAHGLKIFFTARFLIGIRSAIYLTAGILRISFARFILIDAFCAGMIISLFFGLSYWFGEQVAHWIRQGEWVVTIAVLVGCLVGLVVAFWRYSKRAVALLDSDDSPAELPLKPPPSNPSSHS
ncbi:MAG: DedA family protein [Thermoguttaceae bacterium]|nr:DedA family protein [Thermoguttaceae bacterium]MDW8038072.1 DedA family protein [Thermoguttaceae bacterium]